MTSTWKGVGVVLRQPILPFKTMRRDQAFESRRWDSSCLNCDMAGTGPTEVQALPGESWKKYMPGRPRDPSDYQAGDSNELEDLDAINAGAGDGEDGDDDASDDASLSSFGSADMVE